LFLENEQAWLWAGEQLPCGLLVLPDMLPLCRLLCLFFLFFCFFWVTGELSTLRQLMKVPNEPGLSPNNGLENVSLSDQSMASNPLFCVCLYPSREGSLQLRLWMAFRLTLVVSFVACPCMFNE